MTTIEERREAAAKLRALPNLATMGDLAECVFGRKCTWTAASLADEIADLIEPEKVTGETSDGYHTFDELYDHRARLFSVIVRDHRELAWKSRLHHDGTMYDGMFIVGVETPEGQATYHYDVDPYWGIFDCEELGRAPEWDGHTPQQAIDRIAALRPACDRDALLALAEEIDAKSNDGMANPDPMKPIASSLDLFGYARRIREALGVEA